MFMEQSSTDNLVSRRDLLKYAVAATATATAAKMGAKASSASSGREFGHKGKEFPDQRRKYKDSRTGNTVWQLTDTPGCTTVTQYATQSMTSPDGQWLIYGSDRGSQPGQLNLFKMDLRTGMSVQLTESNRDLAYRWSHISPDGKEVYYIEDKNLFKVVDIDTLEEREICRVENSFRPHQLSVSADNRFLIDGVFLENKNEEDESYQGDLNDFVKGEKFLIRSAYVIINTQNGGQRRICDGNTPATHAQYSPTDPNLIMYCHGGPWWYVQRLWMIHPDGTGNRPIFLQSRFEGVGHEFWSEDGSAIYVHANGGRQPQGLWAVDPDGSNERCVMRGPCRGSATANAEQDRFVATDIYDDYSPGLWMSRKGDIEPRLLCQSGGETGLGAAPRFLRDGKTVAFTQGKKGSSEIYLVEV
jgi:oligogalacturonide lyase